jgi:hypothetical protein
MKGAIEIILKSEEARIGRAVKAVVEKSYKINMLKNESHEIRAYVLNETKEYAVVVSDSGKCFCSCHDRFVNEHICKHILMVIFEKLLWMHEKTHNGKGGKNYEGTEGSVSNP